MANDAIECGLENRAEMRDEDERLVSAAQTDSEAAGGLYDKYYREILGYIYHCTLDRATTEDLTSDVFLAAFRHLARFRWGQVPFRAWLYRIATNEVRTYYRHRKRRKSTRLQSEGGDPVGAVRPADERSAVQEEYRLLHDALSKLRLKYRTVIILRYFEDKAIAEIAAITGQRSGTVKSQLHRGLAQLQDILMRRGVLPS